MAELFACSDRELQTAAARGQTLTKKELQRLDEIVHSQCSAAEHEKKRRRSSDQGIDTDHMSGVDARVSEHNALLDSLRHMARHPCNRQRVSPSREPRKRSVPPSKRKKTAAELKPRLHTPRSDRAGCISRCISKDSHEAEWDGMDADLKTFDHFAQQHLAAVDDLAAYATGQEVQAAYANYKCNEPEARVIGPKQLGWCCEKRFCKTNVSRQVKYHGVQAS